MRPLFKHLLRDILSSLPRILLLIITVALSSAVSISALGTYKIFSDHTKKLSSPYSALGDIILFSANSDENLVFERQAANQIGDLGEILGEFELNAFMDNGQLVKISATDLQKADAFYQFKYYEYGKFTFQNLKNSVIVSSVFANKNELSLGDSFTVNLLGEEQKLTIEAIAEPRGILENSDILISISAIKQKLSSNIPIIAALGESIMPYTKLIVKLYDAANVENTTKMISDTLPQYSAVLANNRENFAFSFSIKLGIVFLLATIVVILASILTLGSMTILNRKRRREYALFALSGAEQKHIALLRIFEGGVYSIFASALGIALAGGLIPKISSLFSWQTETQRLTWVGVLFGCLFAPILILCCTLISIRQQKKAFADEELSQINENDKMSRRSNPLMLITSTALALIFTALSFIIPRAYSFLTALIAIMFVIVTLYMFVPIVLSFVCGKIADVITNAKNSKGRGILALRQIQNVYALKQVCRLTALIVALFLSINFCRAAMDSATTLMNTAIVAEHIAINVDQNAEDKLNSLDYVEGIAKIGYYSITETTHGYNIPAFSAKGDLNSCVNKKALPSQMPKGNNAIISQGVASIYGLDVGDNFEVKINGVIHTLKICEIHENNINSVFIDAEALGLDYVMCAIKLNANANRFEDIRKELTLQLSPFGTTIAEPTALFGAKLDTMEGFSALASHTVNICALLILISLCDTLMAHYRDRKNEYRMLSFSGLSKRKLIIGNIVQPIEIVLIAIAFALPTSAWLSFLLDTAAGSFGFSLFGLLA